jgi:hypothetical protein
MQDADMLRHSERISDVDARVALHEALRAGLAALADLQIEARVREHFECNPAFSRDAVHVAAFACRRRQENESLSATRLEIARANPVSQQL